MTSRTTLALLAAAALAAWPALAQDDLKQLKPRPDTDQRLEPIPAPDIPAPDVPAPDSLEPDVMQLPEIKDLLGEPTEPEEPAVEEPPLTREERMDKLFTELAEAPDDSEAAFIAEEIEALWRDSGSPTVDLLTDRATDALDTGHTDLARELIDGAIELGPEHAEAWAESARIALAEEEVGRALEHIEKAVTLEPRHYYALTELGIILEELDSPAGAYEAYQKALALNPRLPDAVEGAERTRREAEGREL